MGQKMDRAHVGSNLRGRRQKARRRRWLRWLNRKLDACRSGVTQRIGTSNRVRFYSKAYHANHYEIRELTFVGTRSQQLYKRNSVDVVKDPEESFRTSSVIATAIKMSARALGNDHS
jgi:hypothetical protein